ALQLHEAVALARVAREAAPPASRPLIVAITVDRGVDELREITGALDPDAIQLSGNEAVDTVASLGRPAWKVLHLPSGSPDPHPDADRFVAAARAYLAAGATRLLLDTAGGEFPGGTGRQPSTGLAAAVA